MLPYEEPSSDPVEIFHAWLTEAENSERNDPTAAALATATCSGVPSVRMVLTKGMDSRGVRFFTNRASQKGRELLSNPKAAMCFHWKSLRRQVRLEGSVQELSREETTEYFHTRSRKSQLGAAVSAQSRPLPSRQHLEEELASYAQRVGDAEVPLPADWTGFLLVPKTMEFWSDGPDRLHDRMRFDLSEAGWKAQRLYP